MGGGREGIGVRETDHHCMRGLPLTAQESDKSSDGGRERGQALFLIRLREICSRSETVCQLLYLIYSEGTPVSRVSSSVWTSEVELGAFLFFALSLFTLIQLPLLSWLA